MIKYENMKVSFVNIYEFDQTYDFEKKGVKIV